MEKVAYITWRILLVYIIQPPCTQDWTGQKKNFQDNEQAEMVMVRRQERLSHMSHQIVFIYP